MSKDALSPPKTSSRTDWHSIATHNGTFTVENLATGTHRTFKIRTQKIHDEFMPGRRIISMLTGSDNTSSFTSFGVLGEQNSENCSAIYVWKKYRGTCYEKMARFIERLDGFVFRGEVSVRWSARCRKCNKELTTPESLRKGIGPVCETIAW